MPEFCKIMENTKTGCRNKAHEEILVIAVNSPDEIPEVYYHRKCRRIFTIKKVSTEFMLMKKRRVEQIQNQLRGHL